MLLAEHVCLFTVTFLIIVARDGICGSASGYAAALQSNLWLSNCSHAITVAISSAALCNCNGPSALSGGYAACQPAIVPHKTQLLLLHPSVSEGTCPVLRAPAAHLCNDSVRLVVTPAINQQMLLGS